MLIFLKRENRTCYKKCGGVSVCEFVKKWSINVWIIRVNKRV